MSNGPVIKLKPKQRAFVENDARRSAFLGGIGSGKTYSGAVRGIRYATQPRKPGFEHVPPSVGIVVAETYTVLDDVVLPEFLKVLYGTGLLADDGYQSSKRTMTLTNGAKIHFRSMERPDRIRGITASWFFMDEGRNLSKYMWQLLTGRLRQQGYNHAGWVTSTPNGFDWMWEMFAQESPEKLDDSVMFHSSTRENRDNLTDEYIADLEATYQGAFFQQEVEGLFVAILAGSAFPHWNPIAYLGEVKYDPTLELYSFWDFGIGDLGVVEFAQIKHNPLPVKNKDGLPTGEQIWVPELRFVGSIEHRDWGAKEWADAWHEYCRTHFDGRKPSRNIGDPAGKQREMASGTSVIDALGAYGVRIQPAPKKAPDTGLFLLDNMMAGGRVTADKNACARLGAAFAQHRFATDDQGNRTGNYPIHDWTSHYCDAARYGAVTLLNHIPKRTEAPPERPYERGELGYLLERLEEGDKQEWLGPHSDTDDYDAWRTPAVLGAPRG